MSTRWERSGPSSGDAYDERFATLARSGKDVHGEATFVAELSPRTVLDAGCGTGRVAIELARLGIDVVGADIDESMLDAARRKAPHLDWRCGDLRRMTIDAGGSGLPRRFDVVVLAGNVMIFVEPGSEAEVVANLGRHLEDDGALVAGFQLIAGQFDLSAYDACATAAGLLLDARYATWDRDPWVPGGDYAVSVHRHRRRG